MEAIDVKSLKRDPYFIKSCFTIQGNITIANTDLAVIFPSRFVDIELATISNVVSLISYYCILAGNNTYAITNAPIVQILTPSKTQDISIDNVNYKLLLFNKDTVFIPNNNLVVRDNFIYTLFNEFFIRGNIPWYISYKDLGNMFLESKKYANNNIGNDPLVFEILTGMVSRIPDDKKLYYRTIASTTNKTSPVYVGLSDVFYSYSNTGAKLIGNYFGKALTSAMLDPETKSPVSTDILRS